MHLAGVQSVSCLVGQEPLLDIRCGTDANFGDLSLLCGLLIAVCHAVSHVQRRQDDHCNDDDASQRTQLARPRHDTAVDASHDLIGLCGSLQGLLLLLCRPWFSRSSAFSSSSFVAIT